MRRMAADKLDPRTLSAPKQGFSGPVKSWIERNSARFRDKVMDSRRLPGLSDLPLERLWEEPFRSRNPFWATEIFSLYCFSVWHQAHVST